MVAGCAFRLLFWRKPRISVIELHGLISPRPGTVSMTAMAPLIERAFRAARGLPVILDIESPGGSPVQSDLIASLIRRRADERKARVHAVIREVGASGGYWLACAADEIVANPMSIVGSIGVRGGGFGFPDLLARLGVERRLYTAGTNKARLDPFSPEKPEDVAFVQELLDALHVRFKAWVRTRACGAAQGRGGDAVRRQLRAGGARAGTRPDRWVRGSRQRGARRRWRESKVARVPAEEAGAGAVGAGGDARGAGWG